MHVCYLKYKRKDPFYNKIKSLLKFSPNSLEYYKRAFIHRSLNRKDINGIAINYERLEFLGDSILSSIISSYLFKNIPDGSEGYLTQMRSKIVSRNHLNDLIGAIFLDRGYPYCKKFVYQNVIIPHVDLEKLKNKIISYKSLFIEWCQKNKKDYNYQTFEDNGNDSVKHFAVKLSVENNVIAKARETSKKKAEEKASKRAFFMYQEEILKDREN